MPASYETDRKYPVSDGQTAERVVFQWFNWETNTWDSYPTDRKDGPFMETATRERSELDDAALNEELEEQRGPDEDDGTGVPGGALPHDDVHRPEQPPTPPAELPDDGADAEADEEQPQLFLLGDKQLGVKVGGKKPESSVLKFKGSKVDLDGQFDLEQRVTTVDVWQVTGDNNKHTIEKASGAVKASSKAQEATLCATVRIEQWLEERLETDEDLIERVFSALELDRPGAGA